MGKFKLALCILTSLVETVQHASLYNTTVIAVATCCESLCWYV